MGTTKKKEEFEFWKPIRNKVEWAYRLKGWKKGLGLIALAFLFLGIFAILTGDPTKIKQKKNIF